MLNTTPGPSIIVAAVNGRHAHRSGPLDDDTAPDFWLDITLKPNEPPDDHALDRMADDGCKNGG